MGLTKWEIVFGITENFVIGVFFCQILRPKINKLVTILLEIIIMLLLCEVGVIFDNYIVVYKGINNFPLVNQYLLKTVITMIGMLLMLKMLFHGKWREVMRAQLLFILICSLGEIIIQSVFYIFGGGELGRNSEWSLLFSIRCMTTFLLSGFFAIIIAIINKYEKKEVIGLMIIQFCLLISEYSAVIILYKGQNSFIYENPIIILFFYVLPALTINLLTGTMIRRLTILHNRENQLKYQEMIGEKEYRYYQLALENEEKIRVLRHETANQLQVLQGLMMAGDMESVRNIQMGLTEQLQGVVRIWYCDNAIINIIIAIKTQEALKQGVSLKAKVSPDLGNVKINEVDLSSILTNLLDNAIREESLQDNLPEKCVECRIGYKQNQLIINVSNDTSLKLHGEELKKLKTTKEDADGHGIGLDLVRKLSEKYGGSVSLSVEEGRFQATVII